ncbi:MAG: PD-(D/E)XK nuclease family protein [Leptospirales bacterium]
MPKKTKTSNPSFPEQIGDLLGAHKETIVLCPNTIDMMRYRILIHEAISESRKTIFHTSLFTPRLWFRKVFYEIPGSEKVLLKESAYKAILFELLSNENILKRLKSLREIVPLAGFAKELLNLWHTFHWFEKTDELLSSPDWKTDDLPSSPDAQSDSIHEPYEDISFIFNELDRVIQSRGFISLQQFIRDFEKESSSVQKTDLNIIYLYPTHISVVEKLMLELLSKVHHAEWTVFTHPESNAEADLDEFLQNSIQPNATSIRRIKTIPDKSVHGKMVFSETSNKESIFFASSENEKQLKARKTDTVTNEAEMVARSINDLRSKGIPASEILILYARPEQAMALQFCLSRFGLKLDCPEGVLALSDPVFSLFFSLLKMLKPDRRKVLPEDFTDILNNPVFNKENIMASHIDEPMVRFMDFIVKTTVEPGKELSFTEFKKELQNVKTKEDEKPLLQYAIKALGKINEDKVNLPSKLLPSEYAERLSDLALKYIKSSTYTDGEISLEKLGKLLNNFVSLDGLFPEGISSGSFFKVLEEEMVQISKPLENVSDVKIDQKEGAISARDIQEGLHSPVSYLFITGLNASSFPLHYRNSGLVTDVAVARKYILQRNYMQQKELLFESLKMTSLGVMLSYSGETDATPSPVCIEILQSCFESKTANDEVSEMISDYTAGSEIFLDDFNSEFQEFLNIKMRLTPGPEYETNFGKTGETQNSQIVGSAGALEILSSCPQRFWFQKILSVEDIDNSETDQPLDSRERGNAFHIAAKIFIDKMQERFPRATYREISTGIQKPELDNVLEECFSEAMKSLSTGQRRHTRLLFEAQKFNLRSIFITYFENFFKTCQMEKHPLSEFGPVATELPFKELDFGPFVLSGRIDRVDYSPQTNTLVVIDYKTGRFKKSLTDAGNIQSLIYAQLPVYIKALAGCDSLLKEKVKPKEDFSIGGAYAFVVDKPPGLEMLFLEKSYSSAEAVNGSLVDEFQGATDALNGLLQKGYFFSAPMKSSAQSNTWLGPCRYCEYQNACDRTPTGINLRRLNDPDSLQYKIQIHDMKKY